MATSETDKSETPGKKSPRTKPDDGEATTGDTLQPKQKFLPTGLSRSIVIAAFVWGAVMLTNGLLANRYELIPAPNAQNSFMYRLDRVTGNVHFCGAQQC